MSHPYPVPHHAPTHVSFHPNHPQFVCVSQGALFGLLLYGTVDLTNCALLTSWSWTVTLVDMTWGSLACSVLALTQRTLCSCFPSLGL